MFKKLSSLVSATCVAFALVASWLFSLRPVSAADIIVNPGESIQAAIDSASPGDTIIIQPGIYTETLTLNKPVSLTGVSSDTVILVLPPEAPMEIPILTLDGATITSEVIITGLTFRSHTEQFGAGLHIINSAQPTLRQLKFIWFEIGIVVGGGLFPSWSPLTLHQTTFENNLFGIFHDSAPITITHASFIHNNQEILGEGFIYLADSYFNSEGSIVNEDGIYALNNVMEQGWGVFRSEAHIVISNTTMISLSTLGIFGNSVEIYNSTIVNNQSCAPEGDWEYATFYAAEDFIIKNSMMANNFTPLHCIYTAFILANETVIENSTLANNQVPASEPLFLLWDRLIVLSSTITNNVGWIQSFGDMVIDQSYLAHNESEPVGNNIFFSGSNLTVTASSLINNNGVWGAQQNVYIANSQIMTGTSAYIGQDLTLINSTLSGHTQPYSPFPHDGFAYGVFQVDGSAYISNSHITHNQATHCNDSSALYLRPDGHATILDSTFAHNLAHCANQTNPTSGAAVAAGSATIENSQFINNQATGLAAYGSAVLGFEVSITDSYFAENNVEQLGFAIHAGMLSITNSTFISHTGPGGLIDSPYLTINQTEFINNQTSNGVIVGAFPDLSDTEEPGYLTLNQSRFIGNHAPAVVSSDYVTITNSLFAHNTPAAPEQPIIEIIEGHLTLHHNTFANESLLANPAVVAYTSSVTVENNIINLFEVGLVGYNSTLWEDYNLLNNSTNISWSTPITHGSHTLINFDPSFNNPAAGNFSLLPGSPAVNAGLDLGYLLDLDNNPRWQSTAPDLGALESPYTGQPLGVFSLTPAALSVDEAHLTAVVTITLDQPLNFSTQVSYETSDNTATAGQDYTPLNGTLTFLPGTTSQTVTVVLLDDTLFEGSETFVLALHNPISGVLGSPFTTTITILDNDPAPPEPITPTVQFAQASYNVGESAEQLVVQVTLDQPVSQTVTVGYLSQNGSATAGQDYSSAAGTLTFLPGTTSQTVTVTILDDALFETDETFALTLNNPVSAVLGSPFVANLTILDNDPAPPEPITPTVQFSQASYNVGESAGQLLVQVTLDQPVSQTVTVGYLSQNGSATAGQDYSSAAGTLTFLPGTTSQTVTVTILDDALFETDETFALTLNNPVSAVLGSPFVANLTILDNDPAPPEPITPTVQFAQASYTTTEEVGSLLFTLSLSETVAHTVTVQIHTIAGSALPGSDYQPFTQTIVFAPGQLTQTISLTLVNDDLPEPTEWLTVSLTNPAEGTLGSISQAVVYILDADTPPPVSHQVYLPVLLRP